MAIRVLCIILLVTLGLGLAAGLTAAAERAEISMLVAFYPESYTGQITRLRVGYFQKAIADYQYWMRWALGDTVDFQYDLVQVERPLGPYDFERDDQGRVHLGSATVQADLAARGVSPNEYAGTLAFFAWNDAEEPIPSRLAEPPYIDGRFASQAVFWPAEPQIGYPEHATKELLEAAFAEVGLKGAVKPNPPDLEGIVRLMAALVEASPGYFESAGLSDEVILKESRALETDEREAALNRARAWGTGHVPHLLDKALLRAPSPEDWLALADRFGRRIEAPESIRVEPLYRTIRGSAGSLIWNPFTAVSVDGRGVPGAKGYLWFEEGATPPRREAQTQSFSPTYGGARPLFTYYLYVLASLPDSPFTYDLRVDVADRTYFGRSEFLMDNVGGIEAPMAAAIWSQDPSRGLGVRLVRQSYGFDDPPIPGSVSAKIEPLGPGASIERDLVPSRQGYMLDLADVGVGEYRVTFSGASDAAPVQDAAVHLAVLPWALEAPEWVTCRVGRPVTIVPRLVGDLGKGEEAAKTVIKPLSTTYVASKHTAEDGSLTITYSKEGAFPLRAVATQEGRLMRPTLDFRVNVVEAGVYEGEDMVAGAAVGGGRCEVDYVALHHPQESQSWSNARQLLFTPANVGDWVQVTVDVPEEADYAIRGTFCGSDGQGTFTAALDGGAPGEELDAYSPTYMLTDPVDLFEAHLTKGPHTLRFTVTGKAAESSGYAFGLDRLTLEKKQPE